jgi:perosamine synthetase
MRIPPVKVVFDESARREVLARIDDCLISGMLAQGKYVEEFEEKWAGYVDTPHAVAVSSGSSAIEMAMRILGVEDGQVLVPVNTFAATAVSVLLAGGKVRFADIDAGTFAVSLADLQKRRTANTAGVIVVHVGGIITPEMNDIRRWCDDGGLWLFEDCAHAHGSEIGGRRAGTFGIAGGYSFFATKVMTTAEGGMIVTGDAAFAQQARLLRNHGKPQPWVSYHTHFGSNWRMSELNAALGLSQLKRLDELIAWRRKIADLYTRWLQELPELTPVLPLPTGSSSWYKYIALLPPGAHRADLKRRMKEQGVSLSGEVYETPLHHQPIFQELADGEFPVASDVCARHICLPLYYGMTDDEARFVVDTLENTLKEIAK